MLTDDCVFGLSQTSPMHDLQPHQRTGRDRSKVFLTGRPAVPPGFLRSLTDSPAVRRTAGRQTPLKVTLIRKAVMNSGTKAQEVVTSISLPGDPSGRFWTWTRFWMNWSSGVSSNKTAHAAARPFPRKEGAPIKEFARTNMHKRRMNANRST